MDNEIEEMMNKFDKGIKNVKDLSENSKPEITENAQETIQNLTSECLKLNMRIEHLQEQLEEFKKEDDYLSKDEEHRKSAEKVFTDRLNELKLEENEALEKLNNAKTSIKEQKTLETKIKNKKKVVTDIATAANISKVKEAISDIYGARLTAEVNAKASINILNEQIMEQENIIKILKMNKRKLLDAPSWDEDKSAEYDKEIENNEEKLSELRNQLEEQDKINEKIISDLDEKEQKYKEFLEKLEYIFYGKDPFKDLVNEEKAEENVVEEKAEEQAEQVNPETQEEKVEEEKKENKEENETRDEEQAKPVNTEPQAEEKVAEEEKTEGKKQENKEGKEPKSEEQKNTKQDRSKSKEGYAIEKIVEASTIKVSAKDRMLYIDGEPVKGIEESIHNKKAIYKKLKMNEKITNVLSNRKWYEKVLNKLFIVPSIKRKLDPTVVNAITSYDDRTENIRKWGDKIGISLDDYIMSIHTKDCLPINLKYDLTSSELAEDADNMLQKYARYANKITDVEVIGLKEKSNIFTKMLNGIKRLSLPEKTKQAITGTLESQRNPKELTETDKIIKEQNLIAKQPFKESVKVDATRLDTQKGEVNTSNEENEKEEER